MGQRTATVVGRLEEHPNLSEVLGVLAQLAHVGDRDLEQLALGWTNTAALSQARDRALSPDSPLVLEVLTAFESLQALFEDDLSGEAAYVTVSPTTVRTALKAVRDAVAAAFARPALSQSDYCALMAPWRSVFPRTRGDEPDLGPRGQQVQALLAAMPTLAARCHDEASRALWEKLHDLSFLGEADREDARDAAFSAAVLTSRRRTWTLLRRNGEQGLVRACTTCRTGRVEMDRDLERVLALCLDAACGLLVADAVSDSTLALLVDPVAALIPQQRRPSS